MLNEMYKPFNAYAVGWMFWGIESMVSTQPIGKMEDFKGLKMRVPQGMTAMLFQELGASVVVLPGGEVYSALDKGVINTSDWASPSMNQRMGFFQVAKYTNYPGFHSMPMASFTVNLNEWNKLPDDIKQILKTACREWCMGQYRTDCHRRHQGSERDERKWRHGPNLEQGGPGPSACESHGNVGRVCQKEPHGKESHRFSKRMVA